MCVCLSGECCVCCVGGGEWGEVCVRERCVLCVSSNPISPQPTHSVNHSTPAPWLSMNRLTTLLQTNIYFMIPRTNHT